MTLNHIPNNFDVVEKVDDFSIALGNKLKKLKKNVKKILLVQPIQVDEEQIDIRIVLNKRYYMYPPYGLAILNKVVKDQNFDSHILDLNFEVFDYIHSIGSKKVKSVELTNHWKKRFEILGL